MTTINTNSSGRTYTIPNLVNDQIYRVRVAAVNSLGQGPYGEYIQVTPSLFSVDQNYYDVGLLMHMDPIVDISLIDPYASNVSLLLHMDGDNDSTVFTDSSLNTKTSSRVNSTKISTLDKQFGSASCYFDGSSYLNVSNKDGDFNFGTGDFTVECWVKMDAMNRQNWILGTPDCGNMMIMINGDNNSIGIGRHCYEWAHWVPHSMSAGNWYHVAVSRSGTNLYMFVNGQMLNGGSPLSNSYSYNASSVIQIGSHANATSGVYQGYIDEYRITKGVARYTSNFTPSSTAFSINPAFVDSSSFNRMLFAQNAALSASTSKFGDYSGYFNGSSYVRSAGGKIWQLGTDDFTIESWINPTSLLGRKNIVGTYDGGSGGWSLAVKTPTSGGTVVYGDEVSFSTGAYGTEVDVIIPGQLEITRGNQQGIYNSALEGGYNYSAPANTVWNSDGWGDVSNITGRSYQSWRDSYRNKMSTPSIVNNLQFIMKHVPTNRYWLIMFTSWGQGGGSGGAFSYTRKEILSVTFGSSIIEFRNGDSSLVQRNTSSPIPTGDWSHVAAVRSSGTLKLFYNGNQVGSDASLSDNITRNNSYGLSIGANILSNGSTFDYFTGYLDDLRITKNVARYSTSFTPPLAPMPDLGPSPVSPLAPTNITVNERNGIFNVYWTNPTSDGRSPITSYDIQYSSNNGSLWTSSSAVTDPYYSDVILLMPMNGDNNSFNFYDESRYNRNVSVYGDTKLTTSQSKFGDSSAYFDRSTDFLRLENSNDFNLVNQDWTIEMWIRPNGDYSNYNTLIAKRDSGTEWEVYLRTGNGALGFFNGTNYETSATPTANVWNHIAAVRYNDTITLYLNGTAVGSWNIDVNSGTNPVYIGTWSNEYYGGYMNDLRITKGVARYKADFDSNSLIQAPANRVTGLTAGTSYVFRSRAQNSVGYGPYSAVNSIPVSTLGAVTSLTVIPDDSQAYLSWTAPTPNNSAIRDYSIQYSSDGGDNWTTFNHSASTNTFITVTGLASTNYVFQVAAVNFAGTGIYSSVSSPVMVAQRLDDTYNKTRLLLHLDSNT